jgi:hypothetical protein
MARMRSSRLRPRAILPGLRLMAGACYLAAMSKTPERMIAGFTTGERDYIRRELDIFFSPCCASTRVFSPRPAAAVPTLASRSCCQSRRD